MRKLLISIAALLVAGAAYAQPIGVRVVKDRTNSRILVKTDDGDWIGVYGAGAPSFTSFLGDSVPVGTIYFNTSNGTSYGFASGSWSVASGGTAAAVTPATTTVAGCTSKFLIADASSLVNCDATAVADVSGAGNGVFTVLKSPTGGSTSSNFLRMAGTQPTTLTAAFNGVSFVITSAGSSSQAVTALNANLAAGYTGSSITKTLALNNSTAGTDTTIIGGNSGVAATSNATTAGTNLGGFFNANGGNINIGTISQATTAKDSASNVGIFAQARNTGATPTYVGGYIATSAVSTVPTLISSALQINNGSNAVPILVAQDNGSALPTTGAATTWVLADGAWPQLGNGVLTSGTATAETQARDSGSMVHSYTITTAMINTALGAGTAGDVLMATLPAKTVVKNAYVIITEAGAGPATLTIACGRTGATYIDYIVASDAKAAANTVYGDTSGERGTNLTGYDLPSYTGTTAVNCHFVAGDTTDLTTGQERLVLETSLIP